MPRRVIMLVGVIALALAGLQMLGVAMDANSILWRAFVQGRAVPYGVGHLLLALAETAIAVCWLAAGITLLRGRRAAWAQLVALLSVSVVISALEATWKLSSGDIDRSQVLSISLELALGVLLALPSVRETLSARARV